MDASSPSPEQLEVAGVLLERAESDLRAAKTLADDPTMGDDVVGFHTQQAVEKSLKVGLVAKGIDFPKTHDLDFLLNLAAKSGLDVTDELTASRWLSPWAAEFRYDNPPTPSLERDDALSAASTALAWARTILQDTKANATGR